VHQKVSLFFRYILVSRKYQTIIMN